MTLSLQTTNDHTNGARSPLISMTPLGSTKRDSPSHPSGFFPQQVLSRNCRGFSFACIQGGHVMGSYALHPRIRPQPAPQPHRPCACDLQGQPNRGVLGGVYKGLSYDVPARNGARSEQPYLPHFFKIKGRAVNQSYIKPTLGPLDPPPPVPHVL